MKAVIAWVVCLSVTSLAHAELLAPKGAKAQLKVEYVFTSSGKVITGAKERIDIWNVRRVINVTAQYTADAPQAVAVLHADDAKQKTEMAGVQARAMSAHKKLEPMQNDVMAMMAKCGITIDGPSVSKAEEKAQEACMEKAATEYGNNMEMTPDMWNPPMPIWTPASRSGFAISSARGVWFDCTPISITMPESAALISLMIWSGRMRVLASSRAWISMSTSSPSTFWSA